MSSYNKERYKIFTVGLTIIYVGPLII